MDVTTKEIAHSSKRNITSFVASEVVAIQLRVYTYLNVDSGESLSD